MNIAKWVLRVLDARKNIGLKKEDIIKGVLNLPELKAEANLLRSKFLCGHMLKEHEIGPYLERKYRYSIAILLERFKISGEVEKNGEVFKITVLGTAKLVNM